MKSFFLMLCMLCYELCMQTMLYSKRVAIFKNKFVQNTSVLDTVQRLLFLYHNFDQYM